MPFRILQLTHRFPYPPHDGGSLAVTTLAEGLADAGNHVTLLAMATSKHPAIPVNAFENLTVYSVKINSSVSILEGLVNLLFSSLPYTASRFISEEYSRKLSGLLIQNQYDIILLEGVYLCPYIALIRRFSTAKIVFRVHNVEHQIWQNLDHNRFNFLKEIYYSILIKRIKKFELSFVNQYDLLVPISDNELRFYNKHGNNKPFIVLPFGIKQVEKNIEQKKTTTIFSIGYIGSLDWMPNVHGIIWFLTNVWTVFYKQSPFCQFKIAGRKASGKIISKLNLPGVIFLGEIENDIEFIKGNDVMIVPLFAGSGIRIKIIQFLAQGKLVICTSKACEGIPVVNGKHLLIADNAADFVSLLLTAKDNPGLFINIPEQAQQFVMQQYSQNKLILRLIEFFKQFC